MEDTTSLLWVALIANLVALNFKIIWEFISKRRNGTPVMTTCPLHGDHHEQIQQLEACVNQLKRDEASTTARVETELKNVTKQMEDGKRNFDGIKADITAIRISIAELVVEAKNNGRRNT